MSNVKINVLCLVGAVFGVAAVFAPWCFLKHDASEMAYGPSTPLDTGSLDVIMSPLELSVFSLLIIAGTIASFVSPLAGGLHISGLLLYLYSYFARSHGILFPETRLITAFGPYFCLMSAAFVLVSLVWPLGLGYDKPISLRNRLLSISNGYIVRIKRLWYLPRERP